MSEQEIIPVHQWAPQPDGRVWLLKVVNADRTSYDGFVWPESGPVTPAVWSREPDCESGGLFGWPWGIGRDGAEPRYGADATWIVFAAHPDDVIAVGIGKVKAVPSPEHDRTPEVIFVGSYGEASARILAGQVSWVAQVAGGAASATGERGAASTTGEESTVEASATGIAASTADVVTWRVVEGAILVLRWVGGHRLVTVEEIGARTGDRVRFERGHVVEHARAEK